MVTDLALHHFIKIRLIDASEGDVMATAQQLGVQPGQFEGEPDITVRFVLRLSGAGSMRHLIRDEAGFTDDKFIVIEGEKKAYLSFGQIGTQTDIVCESGASAVPLLVPIVNLTALAKGIMPIHASAFQYKGIGVLASGWPHGGKTSTLFAFLSHGAHFISDDWLYVDRDGKVYPLLQPVKLHDWQLDSLPEFRARIRPNKLRRMKLVKAADTLERRVPAAIRRRFAPARAYHLLMRYLNKKQRHVYISPRELFRDRLSAEPAAFQKLFLTLSHEGTDIRVKEMSLAEAVNKLVCSLLFEWQEFMGVYLQFRYAFPDHANVLIDELEDRQRKLLALLLADKSIYMVYHPHPVPLQALFEAVDPFLTPGNPEVGLKGKTD